MKRMMIVVCSGVLAASWAWAQGKTADDWEKIGENEYNLGNFDKAAEAFKKGFEAEPNESKKPAYLYNVAQAYRQGKDCKNAQFFYKRFLDLKEADRVKPLTEEKRKEVEGFISALDECARKQEQISVRPPTSTDPPGSGSDPKGSDTGSAGSGKRVAGSNDDGEDNEGSNSITKKTTGAPRVISLRVMGGASKISAGKLDVPIQATGALIAGYPLAVAPQLTLDLGAAFTYTPVPFDNAITGASKSAQFVALLANVGVSYEVIPRLSLRGDVGAGVLLFSGLDDMGNPFTDMGNPTSGALGMFHLRIGASADYAITPNIIATLAPLAFSYSPPKVGLQTDIKSITRLDFMVGLGYRM